MRAFVAALGVSFVVVSAVSQEPAPQFVSFGTVAELHPRHWMFVTSEVLELRVALSAATVYEDVRDNSAIHPAARLKPGVRVRVWWRSIGERRPIVDRVRIDGVPSPLKPARPPH